MTAGLMIAYYKPTNPAHPACRPAIPGSVYTGYGIPVTGVGTIPDSVRISAYLLGILQTF
jgi:hypothetical protein